MHRRCAGAPVHRRLLLCGAALLVAARAPGAAAVESADAAVTDGGCAAAREDWNDDGAVDVNDLLLLLSRYGQEIDGTLVDVSALLALLSLYGARCALEPGAVVSRLRLSSGSLPGALAADVVGSLRTASVHGNYSIGTIADGAPMYEDRSLTFSGLPAFLQGAPGVRTRMNDKHQPSSIEVSELSGGMAPNPGSADEFLCFELLRPTAVYVLYDATAAFPPAWLSSRFSVLPEHRTWQPSDHGALCEDWLDRWSWAPENPVLTSSGWEYADSVSEPADHPSNTCAELVGALPASSREGSRCEGICNLEHAHGAPCSFDIAWTRQSFGPACDCEGTCSDVPGIPIPMCAYDSYCDRSCGYCEEIDPPPDAEQGTRPFDVYRSTELLAGEVCLGDNGAAGAGANYVVVFGPESPDAPYEGCDGVPGSGALTDLCGVCGGDNSCIGCDGVAHSGAVVDECGNCGGAWCEPSDDTEFRIALGGDTQLGRFIDQFVSSNAPLARGCADTRQSRAAAVPSASPARPDARRL